MATITVLGPGAPEYPTDRLKATRFAGTPISAIGDGGLLARHQMISLFCSARCPGDLILKTYDLARSLRDGGITVIGGFHSPMEKECLDLLLRGTQPVIICPARSLDHMRLPALWKAPLAEGRLLLLSPSGEQARRPTAELARVRNELVAAIADQVFIAYADPGSKTEVFARQVLEWGKPVATLDSRENANLVAMGVKPLNIEHVVQLLRE